MKDGRTWFSATYFNSNIAIADPISIHQALWSPSEEVLILSRSLRVAGSQHLSGSSLKYSAVLREKIEAEFLVILLLSYAVFIPKGLCQPNSQSHHKRFIYWAMYSFTLSFPKPYEVMLLVYDSNVRPSFTRQLWRTLGKVTAWATMQVLFSDFASLESNSSPSYTLQCTTLPHCSMNENRPLHRFHLKNCIILGKTS